jgi:predicted RNA polymerase sigma factor
MIVSFYDTLIAIRSSPIVALNRAIAIVQRDGPERGLKELDAIGDRDRLTTYQFYSAAHAELELRCGRHQEARQHFRAALALARNPRSVASSINASAPANAAILIKPATMNLESVRCPRTYADV